MAASLNILKEVYLFGNGINRNGHTMCRERDEKGSDNSNQEELTWECLLFKLNNACADGKIRNIIKPKEPVEITAESKKNFEAFEQKEFPFIYEEILTHQGGVESKIRSEIQCLLKGMKQNNRHKILHALNADAILTTNYDYLIEKSLDREWERPKFKPHSERKYSLRRKHNSGGHDIWHIHGEQDMKTSIMLGFKHYIDYSSQVRDRAFKWFADQNDTKNQTEKTSEASWVDFFFTHNVNIVGLNMGYSEYPLWWLLNYRARKLGLSKRIKPDKHVIQNEVNFLCWSGEDLSPKSSNIHDALRSFKVNIQFIEAKDFDHFYQLILTNKWREHTKNKSDSEA